MINETRLPIRCCPEEKARKILKFFKSSSARIATALSIYKTPTLGPSGYGVAGCWPK